MGTHAPPLFTLEVGLDSTVDNLGPFFCAPQTVVAINNQRFVYGFVAHTQSLVRQIFCYDAERTFNRRVSKANTIICNGVSTVDTKLIPLKHRRTMHSAIFTFNCVFNMAPNSLNDYFKLHQQEI